MKEFNNIIQFLCDIVEIEHLNGSKSLLDVFFIIFDESKITNIKKRKFNFIFDIFYLYLTNLRIIF